MRRSSAWACLVGSLVASAPWTFGPVARADGGFPPATSASEGPGVYGELNGALALGLGAGGALLAFGTGRGDSPAFLAQADLFFLSTVGLKLGYATDARGTQAGPEVRRHALHVDLELRPLFALLFLTNRFIGRETLDLLLYSLGVEFGVTVQQRELAGGPQDSAIGFDLGLGFEIPLYRRGDHGLFLRFFARAVFVPDFMIPRGAAALPVAHHFDRLQLGLMLRYRYQFWRRL